MFFENEILSFSILDVIELKQSSIHMFNSGRNYDALSFRFHADTNLEATGEVLHAPDNSVCFVPARLDYTRTGTLDELIVVHFNTGNYVAGGIELFVPKNAEPLAQLFREILACWNQKAVGYKYKCSAILYEIFAECYAQNYKEHPHNDKIQNAVAYITENFRSTDLAIKKAAERSYMSEVYFRKLFKAEFGVSPQKYIINLRIQHAIGLMSAGYHTLKEIAYMCGYNDYKYFSAEFKRIKGVSPSEYIYNYYKS